jgi:phosphoglycolate phosphatase
MRLFKSLIKAHIFAVFMIKAIFFDMDGVLIDSVAAWFYIFNKTLKHFSHDEISREEFDEKVWARDFNIVSRVYFPGKSVKDIREYFDELKEDFVSYLKVIEGVNETLSKLKEAGKKVAVVTNTHKSLAESMLKTHNLLDYFDFIIGADDSVKGKPEPDMLLTALDELNLAKEEVIFIGDTVWDRMAADNAGIRFIGHLLDSNEKINKINELLDKI